MKLAVGMCNGPQIRQLINNHLWIPCMRLSEKCRCHLSYVANDFLSNHKAQNCADLITYFRDHCCNVSIKVHYLNIHLDRFPEIPGNTSEEQVERFYRNKKRLAVRYQDIWILI
ncbi:hypothetical protein AVEN_118244-1 [Araneus ventricosus]|uniref:Uncharacterized protein n=1 Tax=Araneus ventricosus TaxID=182803 RepID=A0A4Y2PHT4_ARAVE|nr:hypothetical protein AVEN_36184-1 [Araneus ventricosus]GBN50781.1 hypothetical protein AVEN_118244-1 [Araneus ventricosus]